MTFAAGLTLGYTWLILLYIRREWNQQADKLLPEVETGLELDRDLSFIIPTPTLIQFLLQYTGAMWSSGP